MHVKFCVYYMFVCMKIIFFITYFIMVLEYFYIKSKYKGDNSVKNKSYSLLKKVSLDCTCANTDYFITVLMFVLV